MPYYEQPGRTTTIDKDGKQTLSITFVGTQEANEPEGISGTLKTKTVTRDVAGQIRTQFQYDLDQTGRDPGQAGQISGGISVEIVSAVRTVPIEAHPNFKEPHLYPEDLKKIKDAVQVPDRSPTFDDTTDPKRAISLYGYLIAGITSYYEPSIVIRKTYQASSPPSSAKIGKITNPGVFVAGIPAGANFLLVNVSSRGQSGSFTVTEEYEMSGQGGWDSFLYG